jgi:hypothetical protein
MDTFVSDWLRGDADVPWRVDQGFRPDEGTQAHIRQGIQDGLEVIVDAHRRPITVAPLHHALAIVACVNFVANRDRGNPPRR